MKTFFKDKDGNEIQTSRYGSVDKSEIPEYRFVETKKLPNGDIEHVYEKVEKVIHHVDKTPKKEQPNGKQPSQKYTTKQLPNTGDSNSSTFAGLGLLVAGLLGTLKRRKED